MSAAAILGVAGILSAFAGAWLSDRMSDDLSNVLFASLLLFVAIRMLIQLERARRKDLSAAPAT
jgi:uncharacterized membrane protein YfcA